MSADHPEASLGQEHHIAGSHNQEMRPGNSEWAVLGENSHQIGQSEDDPCPTNKYIRACSLDRNRNISTYATLQRASVDIVTR